jgi:hypothetical protein
MLKKAIILSVIFVTDSALSLCPRASEIEKWVKEGKTEIETTIKNINLKGNLEEFPMKTNIVAQSRFDTAIRENKITTGYKCAYYYQDEKSLTNPYSSQYSQAYNQELGFNMFQNLSDSLKEAVVYFYIVK